MHPAPSRASSHRGGSLPAALVLAFVVFFGTGRAAAADVLAIVPQIKEPYRSVLYQIVDGMRRTATVRVVEIPPDTNSPQPALSIQDEKVAIALGDRAVSAAAALQGQVPVVAGAIVVPVGQPPMPGLSLEADPGELFRQLVALRPGIRTVHWLYRPQRSNWLLKRAQAAAVKHRLTLAAVAVDNARAAAQQYQEILSRADSTTDALWLSQDPALVSNDSALPDILGKAWARNIVVFSGSVQHVAHGVLFALTPDNEAMGSDLARLALAHAGGAPMQFEPNRSLQRAINRRTAEHLGINAALGDYDFVFPAR